MFTFFFFARFGPTRLGLKEEAIFAKYVDVVCVYVKNIYDDECSTQLCSCSFVRIVVAKLEKITL